MGISALRQYHYRRPRLNVDTGEITPPQSDPSPALVPSAGDSRFNDFLEEQMKNPSFAKAFEEEAKAVGLSDEELKAARKPRKSK